MNNRIFVVTVVVTAFVSACTPGAARRDDSRGLSTFQRGERAESLALARETDTIYKRRMLDFIRRSRLVPTDSLTRLYIVIPETPRSELWRIRVAIGCENFRLGRMYGLMPWERAFDRMIDSLERSGVNMKHLEETQLAAPGEPMTIGQRTCGEEVFQLPTLPDSIRDIPRRTAWRKP
jgi:hypothetical protein